MQRILEVIPYLRHSYKPMGKLLVNFVTIGEKMGHGYSYFYILRLDKLKK